MELPEKLLEIPQVETVILSTYQEIVEFLEWAFTVEEEVLVVDVETDSKEEKKARLYGMGLCFQDEQAFYLVFRNQDGTPTLDADQFDHVTLILATLFKTKKLVGHNIIYDALVIKNNLYIDCIPYIYSDTILLKHAISEEEPFGLKEVAVEYLGPWADKAQERLRDEVLAMGGRWTKEEKDMFLAASETLGSYCCWDTILTLKLFNLFEPQLHEQGLANLFYKDETMPLYRQMIATKDKGFRIDLEHFKRLKSEITNAIKRLEHELYEEVGPLVREYEKQLLNEMFPIKRTGNFPKVLAQIIGLDLKKNGKVTLAQKHLQSLEAETTQQNVFLDWMVEKEQFSLPGELLSYVDEAQYALYQEKTEGSSRVFNLGSNDDLKHLFFDILQLSPKGTTEKGAPKLDADTLESYAEEHPFAAKLVEMKQLGKLLSTYVDGMLDRAVGDHIYASFLLFGTISGRFSSRNPNLQNLPRVKEDDSGLSPLVLKYANEIKRGFIAEEGHVLVNADYSQLEPCAFAAASGDAKLQQVFRDKQDLYSAIAIEAEGLQGSYSADKKAPNYLKNHKPELRQKYKAVALAVVYGAEAGRISKLLHCTYQEAQKIIDAYLDAYPGLKKYIARQENLAVTQGYVRTDFGRIRHLPQAKEIYSRFGWKLIDRNWAKKHDMLELRYKFKNSLNNAKNMPIQGIAAHVVNRATLEIGRRFKEEGIEGWIVAQVHDELTSSVRADQANRAATIVKECMENTTRIAVPLVAEPKIAANWADSK